MSLGAGHIAPIEGISTGSLSLDIALGGQGIPRGRVVEIFGPESSGKTTLALHVVAQAQRKGGIAAFIDAEHALDPSWAKKLGVDLETLLVSQPGSGEEAMHIAEMLIKSNAVDVIVIDSVAALVPAEGAGGRDRRYARRPPGPADEPVAPQAHRRDLQEQDRGDLHQPDPREDRRDVRQSGDHPRRPGPEVLHLLPHRRAPHRPDQGGGGGHRPAGPGKVVKNKVAPPFRMGEFDMLHTSGISYEGDVLDLAMAQKLVTRTGTWFRYGDMQLGQGREKAREYLKENPALAEELRDKILAAGSPPRRRRQCNRGSCQTSRTDGVTGSSTSASIRHYARDRLARSAP